MKDPVAIGLYGFAIPLFILAGMFAGLLPMDGLGLALALALAFGAACMFIGGTLTWQIGNAFVATAFFVYGSFFLALAIGGMNGSLMAALKDAPQVVSVWYFMMAFVTFVFFVPATKMNIGLVLMFGLLTVAFVAMGLGIGKIGGLLFGATAIVGFYLAAVHVVNPVMAGTLPVGSLVKKPA
jgi:succinate-acetate transporter protein